jgi:hypothetical protein
MKSSRPEYLIDKLIKNKLTKEELEELLSEMGENEMSSEYSEILERYFNQLLVENAIKKDIIL